MSEGNGGVEMEAGLAWLSSVIGDDRHERWQALGPIAGLALKRNDLPALKALLAAGASPGSAMEVSLKADDDASWALLLPVAVIGEKGVVLRLLRGALQKCADQPALKCFEATAAMLGGELSKIAASAEEKNSVEIARAYYDERNLWEALAKVKTPAARAMAHAADAAGYSIHARWPQQGYENDPGVGPLRAAISASNFELVNELFAMGAKARRMEAVMAVWSKNSDMLSLVLRSSGVDPEKDGWPNSPLEAAITSANADAVRILLAAGADPNGVSDAPSRRGGYELSMLGVAIEQPTLMKDGCATPEEICAILLAAGADPSRGESGKSPMDLASHKLRAVMKAALDQQRLVAEIEASASQGVASEAPARRL